MNRVRISTTVDGEVLATCRRLTDTTDSRIVDRALRLLVARLEGERERAALRAEPYADDPDLAWQAPPGESLPYDGDIPSEVIELARRRRSS